MLALDPSQQLSPGWMHRFRTLGEGDVRGPGRESDDKSEGMFHPSWIWLVSRSTTAIPNEPFTTTNIIQDSDIATASSTPTVDDPEVAESMRTHWAKCQARADRYEEEVALTVEEMG